MAVAVARLAAPCAAQVDACRTQAQGGADDGANATVRLAPPPPTRRLRRPRVRSTLILALQLQQRPPKARLVWNRHHDVTNIALQPKSAVVVVIHMAILLALCLL